MLAKELSPQEKRKVERLIRNVRNLHGRWPKLSDSGRFIFRQQLRVLLIRLGADRRYLDPHLRSSALEIITDWKPFKIRRLRKLINGRRPRQ